MGDAEKHQHEVCNSGQVDADTISQFTSLVRVFTALLAALQEGQSLVYIVVGVVYLDTRP